MEYDSAIINAESIDPRLAVLLSQILEEYRTTVTIDVSRHQCHEETIALKAWLLSEGYIKDTDLEDEYMFVAEGTFEVDYPNKLPLDLMDLEQGELDDFLDIYEEQIDLKDTDELSDALFEFIRKHLPEDRQGDFYFIDHVWLYVGGALIDITWSQFSRAIDEEGKPEERRYTL